MTLVAVIGNGVLFLFTCFVLGTEGPSKGGGYVVLTLLLLLVPVLSSAVILRGGAKDWRRSRAKTVAAVANVVLLGFVFWAIVSTYPHPEESGVVPFAVTSVVAPILNLLVLLRPGESLKPAM